MFYCLFGLPNVGQDSTYTLHGFPTQPATLNRKETESCTFSSGYLSRLEKGVELNFYQVRGSQQIELLPAGKSI
jgi:hypothetical protein